MRTMFAVAVAGLGIASTTFAGVDWESDYDRARERAIKEDKLLFIDFYATW